MPPARFANARQPIPRGFRAAGGPGGQGAFRFTWQGGRIAQMIDDAVEEAMDQKATEIAVDLKNELHRVTSEMADKSFAEVYVTSGRRTLSAGSDAPHTVYHELGTARFEGHPQIRQIMDRHIPTVPPRIRAFVQRKGRLG